MGLSAFLKAFTHVALRQTVSSAESFGAPFTVPNDYSNLKFAFFNITNGFLSHGGPDNCNLHTSKKHFFLKLLD
jgi:hypothetical protein